ncbi:Ig-like domain-containing protein [Paenibacillus hodogayensis]|uniref:Ig-like domain-containing protein n=1 Tax=Paenibacillus hodogayensis TaxID=279208 RepID=A0ABV5W0V8_9BACL
MKKTMLAVVLLATALLGTAWTAAAETASNTPLVLEIEAASGAKKQIDAVDAPSSGNYLAVLTDRYGDKTNNTNKYNVAVQVSSDFIVTKIANKAPAPGTPPPWQDSPNLDIPPNGFVLLASDDAYASRGYKKFLAENFTVGDRVKLNVDGVSVALNEFKQKTEHLAQPSTLVLDQTNMFPVSKDQQSTAISGKLTNYQADGVYRIVVNGQQVPIRADGLFSYDVQLQPKTNYITVEVYRGPILQNKSTVTVYRYMQEQQGREVYLWIEQSTNLNKYPSSASIRALLVKAKNAGVTAVAFPVKGHEGFLSYLQNDLSGLPHISQITEATKTGVPADLDVLQEYIRHGHELGLRIDAVFNLYGSGTAKDTGLTPGQFASFEEWVYRPEDGGNIVPIRQSAYKPSVYFLNPANENAQQLQMLAIEEVMRHYDVDCVVLDRARYDNLYADFSNLSKLQFEQYLTGKGKTLAHWPQDIFEHKYDASGKYTETVNGPLFYDWLTYRSTVSKTFFQKLRTKVDQVNLETGKHIPLANSMGSWYTSYYEVGQNWASPDFRYDPRLGLNLPGLYTEEYANTAFGTPDIFDYLILGTYYNTPEAVIKGIALIHVLTMEQFPVYAGFQLQQLPDPEDQRQSFQAALKFTNGIKLFDLSVINWDIQKAALEDRPYVKPYQLGISIPNGLVLPDPLKPFIAKGFIEGDYFNQNRALDTVGLYTEAFGPTTGTSGSYGVEVIVGADGKVTDVVNKQQAINWQWSGNRVNNSIIPAGGFVLSALDKDGIRVRRQLLANAYSIQNDVRAALLRGHLDYKDATTSNANFEVKGNVEVLGPGTAAVKLNGAPANMAVGGDFSGTVPLQPGANDIAITVEVDGSKTNEATIRVTRLEPVLKALELDVNGGKLYEGETYASVVTAVYSDGSRKPASGAVFVSSNPGTVSVSVYGEASALRQGTSVITASLDGLSATQTVTVISLTSISVDDANVSLIAGETHLIGVTAAYADGSRRTAAGPRFSTSHEAVATVASDGLVKAVKPGRSTITVSYGDKRAEVRVKVFHHKNPGNSKNDDLYFD